MAKNDDSQHRSLDGIIFLAPSLGFSIVSKLEGRGRASGYGDKITERRGFSLRLITRYLTKQRVFADKRKGTNWGRGGG